MTEITKKWINAGKILEKDKNAIVKCPVCEIGYLQVKDEKINNYPGKIDRYLICSNCGEWNVITMDIG
jgi:hypothetical protein